MYGRCLGTTLPTAHILLAAFQLSWWPLDVTTGLQPRASAWNLEVFLGPRAVHHRSCASPCRNRRFSACGSSHPAADSASHQSPVGSSQLRKGSRMAAQTPTRKYVQSICCQWEIIRQSHPVNPIPSGLPRSKSSTWKSHLNWGPLTVWDRNAQCHDRGQRPDLFKYFKSCDQGSPALSHPYLGWDWEHTYLGPCKRTPKGLVGMKAHSQQLELVQLDVEGILNGRPKGRSVDHPVSKHRLTSIHDPSGSGQVCPKCWILNFPVQIKWKRWMKGP